MVPANDDDVRASQHAAASEVKKKRSEQREANKAMQAKLDRCGPVS